MIIIVHDNVESSKFTTHLFEDLTVELETELNAWFEWNCRRKAKEKKIYKNLEEKINRKFKTEAKCFGPAISRFNKSYTDELVYV